MLMQMSDLTLGEAARALGVSVDTLRRWDRAGKVRTVRDERNRRRVPASEVERLSTHPDRHRTGDGGWTRLRVRAWPTALNGALPAATDEYVHWVR